jgi:phosphonate transport system substrate-binding protein
MQGRPVPSGPTSVGRGASRTTRRRLALALASAPLAVWAPAKATAHPRLRLGLVPYLSTRAIVNVFEPLRAHLATATAMPVDLFTARDLRHFSEQLRDGEHDIAFAPIHFMRLAAQDWGWRIVAQVATPSRVVILRRRGEPLRQPRDLAGKRLVSLDRHAITSMLTLEWLRGHGLEPGRDLQVDYLVTATSTMRALADPQVDALALIDTQLPEFPPDVREAVEVAMEVGSIPPPGYVVHERLGAQGVQAVAQGLLSFGGTADAQGALSRSPIVASQFSASDGTQRFAEQLRRLLA